MLRSLPCLSSPCDSVRGLGHFAVAQHQTEVDGKRPSCPNLCHYHVCQSELGVNRATQCTSEPHILNFLWRVSGSVCVCVCDVDATIIPEHSFELGWGKNVNFHSFKGHLAVGCWACNKLSVVFVATWCFDMCRTFCQA